MKVKCVNTGGAALFADDVAFNCSRSTGFHVTVGREYSVYGLLFDEAVLRYLILANTGHPQCTNASLFQVVCGRVSRLWMLADWSSGRYVVAMTFPDFVRSPEEFGRLQEGDDSARDLFYKWQQFADLEFLDTSVEKSAESLEGNWLMCPQCIDAWEYQTMDEMVRCPKCHTVLRNPKPLPRSPFPGWGSVVENKADRGPVTE